MADFLKSYFKSNDSNSSSTTSYLEQKSSLIIFTGLWNASCLYDFIYLISILMPTALLICMENTFWNISRDGNFMELFKKSFTLYVESGMRKKMEADIDILRNQGGHLVTNNSEFKAKFCKVIIEHYLRKFHSRCFYLHSTSTNHFLHLNIAHTGDQAFEDLQTSM